MIEIKLPTNIQYPRHVQVHCSACDSFADHITMDVCIGAYTLSVCNKCLCALHNLTDPFAVLVSTGRNIKSV